MEYETSKTIICSDTNETYRVGDIVNIKRKMMMTFIRGSLNLNKIKACLLWSVL